MDIVVTVLAAGQDDVDVVAIPSLNIEPDERLCEHIVAT